MGANESINITSHSSVRSNGNHVLIQNDEILIKSNNIKKININGQKYIPCNELINKLNYDLDLKKLFEKYCE